MNKTPGESSGFSFFTRTVDYGPTKGKEELPMYVIVDEEGFVISIAKSAEELPAKQLEAAEEK